MVIMAELQMQGEKHVQVNSGLLKIVKNVFADKPLIVFCDNQHQTSILKNNVDVSLVKFETFKYTGDKEVRKIWLLSKIIREVSLSLKIFRRAKHENSKLIVFFSAFPFTALFLNFFAKIFEQRIIICLHGDIGVLSLKRNKFTIRVFRNTIKFFFITRSSKTVLLFYGQPISEKFFEMYPSFRKDNTITIDHPYNYEIVDKLDSYSNSNIVIANIGTGIMNKNSHLFYKLAEMQRDSINLGRVKFVQIGNISSEVQSYSNKYVDLVNDNKFIPFDIFEEKVRQADYFIYFFSENTLYDLCPSGTFFDALKYRKPIISLSNPFFKYYFEKLGNIGYLCNSVDEMSVLITEIIENKRDENYFNQVNNLLLAQDKLSILNISKSFMTQFDFLK
jgi:hypothetical protein